MNIDISTDECISLFAIAKEGYVLTTYHPKPEVSQDDRTWLGRFKQFTRDARENRAASEMEQWPEFRVAASDQGYSITAGQQILDSISRSLRAILSVLDETDVHARTGKSKDYYSRLVDQVFGS